MSVSYYSNFIGCRWHGLDLAWR